MPKKNLRGFCAVSNTFGRGLTKKHFCQVILKSVQRFVTRRFLKFSI